MADMPKLPTVSLATFTPRPDGEPVTVHFNPESLQYTVSNTLKGEGSGKKKQYVDGSEAKLSMTLIFDTTDSGDDVRGITDRLVAMLKPVAEGKKQVPPEVEFGWGAYAFVGMVEQYKETLDFFSEDGVPLRASVELTLTDSDFKFQPSGTGSADTGADDPAVVPATGGSGPSGVANQLGDPRAARAIASANGAASLRFGGDAGLAVSAGVSLKGEAAFSVGASAGAGLSIGGGASAGAGVGIGGGIGGGIGVGGGASAGIGLSAGASLGASASGGAGLSLGASATASSQSGTTGAFSGLRASASASHSVSLPSAASVFSASGSIGASGGVSASASASFGIGGQASGGASGGMTADVGLDADLNALIRF